MKCPRCKGTGKIERRVDIRCHDCRGLYSIYMVYDGIWHEALKTKKALQTIRVLCLGCLERRLGRPLTIENFTWAPVNDGIRLGHALGVLAYARRKRRR